MSLRDHILLRLWYSSLVGIASTSIQTTFAFVGREGYLINFELKRPLEYQTNSKVPTIVERIS